MLSSTIKPLPDIPFDPPLLRLTIESNALIHSLIQRALDEEGLEVSWTTSIKYALAEFGESLVSQHWLPGLRTARKAQSDALALAARAYARKERERLNEMKTGKSKINDKVEAKATDIGLSKDEEQRLTMREMRALTSVPPIPTPVSSPKHLLITMSSRPTDLPETGSSNHLISPARRCAFLPDVYSFPFFEDDTGKEGEGGSILYGLDTWTLDKEVKPRIVGGNFVFHDLSLTTAHDALGSILRLSIYTYLSLILEQNLLSNSHTVLQFPSLPPPPSTAPLQGPKPTLATPTSSKRKVRSNKGSSGIWSFLSKKTENIFHRNVSNLEDTDEPRPRASSLDIISVFSSSRPSRRASDVTAPGSSTSTITESRAEEDDRRLGLFASAVQAIQDRRCVLTTSPGVEFPLPPLLARLAKQEQEQEQSRSASASESSSLASSVELGSKSSIATAVPATTSSSHLRLTAIEKAGLGSILGWEGRSARGKGMAALRSFVRHQALTVLYAEHLPPDVPCGRPRWMTLRYWARERADDTEADETLGQLVERLCSFAEELCGTDGCLQPRGRHQVSWTCSSVRICGKVSEDSGDIVNAEDITMWESCKVCGERSERMRMGDGTYLFSFSKYLELLLWSPMLAALPLCEHLEVSEPAPAETRFRILRHFAWRRRLLTISLTSVVDDVFEIRVPKLQVASVPKEEKQLEEARRRRDSEEEKRVLIAEMDEWWESFRIRLDLLDAFLQQEVDAASKGKDLPPLPISDDEDLREEPVRSGVSNRIQTPSPRRTQANRTTALTAPFISRPNTPLLKNTKPEAPYPPGLPVSIHRSRELLVKLRLSFQKTEDVVRKQAAENSQLSLNDVRRTFRSTARGASKRLAAWQQKHAPGAPISVESDSEPEWWQGTCHAIPGSRVLVREDEWGSVIAFTLSSLDYQRELIRLSSAAALQTLSHHPSTTSLLESQAPTPVATVKALKSSNTGPDPDDSEATSFWEEPEPWTSVITRREHPRELSSLLSLREVLRTKKSFDSSSFGSRFAGSASRGVPPPLAWAQPQVQVNFQSADGQVSQFPEAAGMVEQVLGAQYTTHHEAESTFNSENMATPTPSSFVEKNIRSGKSASILSLTHLEGLELLESHPTEAPSPPTGLPITSSPRPMTHGSEQQGSATNSSSFTSAFSSVMQYFLNTGSPPTSRSSSPVPPSAPHHGLLALETTPIDDRPHIKYEWTVGKRLKFSCTVYYAKQFDALRKRCGVDDIMLKSLERTECWTAVGGKSKSNFWKSVDDRFIIKTLVNAWNVADLQVLIDLGPSYFRYIESTANKPSMIAKLMGFYTVEIKNLETGAIRAKADLLVMENLFYGRKVSKTFDLKGIQSRRAKAGGDGERHTLFDGEWVDGQQRSRILIQPYSKLILHEAIRSDAEFLAKSNIMDYSLLLGVDEQHHEIACGLVDTIGSYTFAKTLEYKAKQNLNSGKGKEVTVIPPTEYQNRFVHAIEGYFLACPDKWTKPPQHIDRTTPSDLPSVL